MTNEARRQRRAIEAIKKLGGSYQFDYEFVGGDPGGTKLPGSKPPGPAWLRRWIGDEPFRDVVRVCFSGNGIRDDDLGLLEDLPRLQEVDLFFMPNITDSALAHFHGQRRLRNLFIYPGRNIGDAGMIHLRDLNRLEFLALVRTKVGNVGVEQLLGLKSLRKLSLMGSKITDAGLVKLGALPLLTEINATDTVVSKVGVSALQESSSKVDVIIGPSCPN